MTEREQAAENKYPLRHIHGNEQYDGAYNDDQLRLRESFLAGCEHTDREHREFYLKVRAFIETLDKPSGHQFSVDQSLIISTTFKEIKKHLDAFTEREQQSLPFKPEKKVLFLDPKKVTLDDVVEFCGKENVKLFTGVTKVITKKGEVQIDSYDMLYKHNDGSIEVNPKEIANAE